MGPRPARSGLVAVDRFYSAHCIAYHASAYDVALRMRRPLDVQLGDLGARPVVAVPFVAHQRPGWSAHMRKLTDYTKMYVRHESHLLRVDKQKRGAAA